MDPLSTWENAASPAVSRPDVPDHRRGGVLAPPRPAARLIELTNLNGVLRGYLAEAAAEVRRLRARDQRWHSMSGTSFGGIPMAQVWADLILWEAILNENPELRGIVEIGTWQGGFSLWLQRQAQVRTIGFRTFDAVVPESEQVVMLLEEGWNGKYPGEISDFARLDVFAKPEVVARTIKPMEPVILFCDGGNKPRELATFTPYLQDPRSLVIVHDWGTETLQTDVPETLEEIYGDFCDDLGSISRVFKVRR